MKIMPSGLLEITDVKITDVDSDYRCKVALLNGGLRQLGRAARLKLKLDGGKVETMIHYLRVLYHLFIEWCDLRFVVFRLYDRIFE